MEKEKPDGKNTVTKVAAELTVVAALALLLMPLISAFFSVDTAMALVEPLARLYFYLNMVATIISMACIAIAVYAFVRLREIKKEEAGELGIALTWEHERIEKNHRWERVEEYMRSTNPSDWKVAILEADNILDEIVERMGYQGETLGERMKMIEASDFPHLEDAWKAHKTRNDIAHQGGPEYVLTRSLADGTINVYHRIFKELGYL